MLKLSPLHNLLKKGVQEGIFPGAVAGIFYEGRTYILSAGYASLTPFLEPMEEAFIFDLASLTKPLALGLILIKVMEKHRFLDLEKPLKNFLNTPELLGNIPLFRFLNHTSGLKAWYPFYKEKNLTLEKIFKIITQLPLEFSPGEKTLYSDLNFFLLTYFLEKIFSKNFEDLFESVKNSFSKKGVLLFNPLLKGIDQEKIVPTSYDPLTKKFLRGVVEDENTRALSGVSGVAGLFGNIYGVLTPLIEILKAFKGEKSSLDSSIVHHFIEHKDSSEFSLVFMKASNRGYSATGGAFSKKTIGHLGFTGCSFFIDLERSLIVVLLTNRVHPFRENEAIKSFRPLFHQKVIENLS